MGTTSEPFFNQSNELEIILEECIVVDISPPPSADVEVVDEQIPVSKPPGQTIPAPSKQKVCPRCNNLVQNPSFEDGLTGWETNNVLNTDGNPFEGTQVAKLGPGMASLFQDVSLAELSNYPLFLSFEVITGSDKIFVGNLVVEILWLDASLNQIATGLRLLIPEGTINTKINMTYFDITDQPPTGAIWARLMFSKGAGRENPDTIEIDQIILTPIDSINLVQNPGFQLGLTKWNSKDSSTRFFPSFEGTAFALLLGDNATLSQDVSIGTLPGNSSFLFSFAVTGAKGGLIAEVLWFDNNGNQLGMPGLSLSISLDTLENQNNYLTYLAVTQPAPAQAVKAQIMFTAKQIIQTVQPNISIDKVILVKTKTTNLVKNFSFENDLSNWTAVDTTVVTLNQAYEGNKVARIPIAGGSLFQDIPIPSSSGRCFLLSFGYRANGTDPGILLAEVRWMDNKNNEIGLGLSLVVPSNTTATDDWLVYTGITETAPQGTVMASVQFSKSNGSRNIDIDNVILSLI